MKLRQPGFLKAMGFGMALAIRGWMSTLKIREYNVGPPVSPNQCKRGERCIFTFWHENLLLPAYLYGRPNIHVLISQHADGEMIAEACRHLRMKSVRGSTTRGGTEAVRQLLRVSRSGHLAVTPDGPRGPRRELQPGLVFLASRTGLPIVPLGVGYDRPWRARSWDRFAIPRPGSRAVCLIGEPIPIPARVKGVELEHYNTLVADVMRQVTEEAERRAEGLCPRIPATAVAPLRLCA